MKEKRKKWKRSLVQGREKLSPSLDNALPFCHHGDQAEASGKGPEVMTKRLEEKWSERERERERWSEEGTRR